MTNDFDAAFKAAIDGIHTEASRLGVPMTELCGAAGVARETAYRYRRGKVPATVRNVSKLQAEIAKRAAK